MFKDPYKKNKWEPTWVGPFIVSGVDGNQYEITDLANNLKKHKVSSDMLKLIDGSSNVTAEERFIVDHIVEHKQQNDKPVYRVRWKDYSADDDTWEPEEAFDDVATIRNYLEKDSKKQENTSAKKEKKKEGKRTRNSKK